MEVDGSLKITCEENHGIQANAVANCAGTGTVQPVRPHALDLQLAHERLSMMSSCRASLVISPVVVEDAQCIKRVCVQTVLQPALFTDPNPCNDPAQDNPQPFPDPLPPIISAFPWG